MNLFRTLKNQKIAYVLLTDFENVWRLNEIDMFVPLNYKERFLNCLKELHWIKRIEPAIHKNHNYYANFNGNSIIWLDVKYQPNFAYRNYEYEYKDSNKIIDTKKENNNHVYRPSGVHAIVLYSAHIAFNERGVIEKRHYEKLKSYLKDYKEEISFKDDCLLIKSISDVLDCKEMLIVDNLRKLIINRFYKKNNNLNRKRVSGNGIGYFVVFLGPDGSGKTTLIEMIDKNMPVKTSEVYLGEKYYYFNFVDKLNKCESNMAFINVLSRYMYMYLFLPIDIRFRIWRVSRTGRYRVILADRLPGFPFVTKSKLLKYIYRLVIPRLDLLVLLDGDASVFNSRKQEVGVKKVREDSEKFRKVKHEINANDELVIDTTESNIEDSYNKIVSVICLNKNFKNRMFDNVEV